MALEVHNPVALVLLVFLPLAILVGRRSLAGLSPGRSIVSTVIRCLVMLAVILALADLHLAREGDLLTTVFVVDQSRSIPADWRRREAFREINDVIRGAGGKDRVGLVLFGADASIEKVPQPIGLQPGGRWISDIASYVNPDHTDIAGALRLATAVFPENSMKRIVLFSEGNENKGVAIEEAERAKTAGVVIDVVPMEYDHVNEVLVEKVLLPARLKIEEPFKLRVVIWSLQPCKVHLFLTQDGEPVGPRDRTVADPNVTLAKGKTVLTYEFKKGLPEGGPYSFKAQVVVAPELDGIMENNTGVGYTFVESGEPKILLVENDVEHARFLVDALREEKIGVTVVDVASMPPDHKMAGYDSIIISNVPAGSMRSHQMQTIARCVTDLGVGLVWVGGENSFGAGAWRNTPIERVSPISCDIKQRRVLPKGALVLIMDAAEVAQGNRWCIEMASEAVSALSSRDEIAIMANAAWKVPLGPVGDHNEVLREIRTMQVGDVCDFNGMLREAGNVLKGSDASTKHIILMSDAGPNPSWEISDFLVRQFTKEKRKITVSTVVFKDHFPGTVKAHERAAMKCGGSFYHPQSADELPRIFVKEAAVITRSLIHEEPFVPVRSSSDYSPIMKGFDAVPELGGYVVVTPKPDAEVPLVRKFKDENEKEIQKDPILAHRQEGLGRTVAFMSDAKNRWGTNWVGWPGYKRFWSQAVRWSLRSGPKGSVHTPTIIEISEGKAHVVVEALDDEGKPVNMLSMQARAIRPSAPDDADGIIPVRLTQTGVGRYEGWFPARDTGSYFLHVHYEGKDNKGKAASGDPVSGVVVAYSPEYRELNTNISLLENIAGVTGGRVLEPSDEVFDRNLPVPRSSAPVWDLLMLFAILAFPLDVFVRKVVIDRQQVVSAFTAVAALLPVIGARFEKKLPAVDPAIARLLAKKREVRERLDQPAEEAVPSAIATLRAVQEGKQEEHATAAMSDEQLDTGIAAAEPREPKLKPKRGAPETRKARDDAATPYTQRLLQAKKRALKRRDKE